MPATMNSVAVLIVSAGGMSFGIPRDAIRRTEALRGLQRLADRYVLNGQPEAMMPLAELIGRDAAETSIVVEIVAQSQPFLLGVDSIVGIRQTVIYTLPPYLETEPFVLGASVDSAGQVLPILDPALLAPSLEEFLGRSLEASPKSAKALPILVVDDSLTTRMLEQSVFEMEGYSVDLASSAEEALDLASKHSYGLFVVDVEMPGMDGITFVAKTRHDPILRETPVILVTSRGSAEDKARGLKAGAKEYIVKSNFDQRYLLDRVRELIRHS